MAKKLIEVALPLEAINAASVREKSIRHGHPSALHLWWSRKPLATCRAILFAQLVDDPSSHPEIFPTEEAQEQERSRLFAIIEDLIKWENSTNSVILKKACAEIVKNCSELPVIYDPFSGGGSIPLEAQRLGLSVYGSDLNPVAVMIGKAMIEIPTKFKDMHPVHPGGHEQNHYRHAEGLAEDMRYYGEWMRKKAFERTGYLYPQVDLPSHLGGGKATVIAWLWVRTVPSPDPAFSDVHVPLTTSFLLSSKVGKEVWVEPVVDRKKRTIQYKIHYGGTKEQLVRAKTGTSVGRGNFVCLLSNAAITPAYIKEAGRNRNMQRTLIAIVVEGKRRRHYIEPDSKQEKIAISCVAKEKPETELPNNPQYCSIGKYGLKTFGDLFTSRQLVVLNTFTDLVDETREQIEQDAIEAGLPNDKISLRDGGTGAKAYAEAVSVYLSFSVSKLADRSSANCSWNATPQALRNTFGRQALPMIWDFAEANPFSDSTGNFKSCIEGIYKVISKLPACGVAREYQRDAQTVKYPPNTVISTDPPYYDNIGYADLSDFFYVWLRRNLKNIYPDIFGVLATPKQDELVADSYRHGGRGKAENFFLKGMRKAIYNMANQASPDHPATIYYAFKQSEASKEGVSSRGWATFLQAMMDAGYSITGTWPMRTERAGRMTALNANVLANSVVLVCRKRSKTAETIFRGEFIRALDSEFPDAVEKLKSSNISATDLRQSAIGPGMAIFSRYKAVLETDDTAMSVNTALQIINQKLDQHNDDLQGDFDDETRFAITWFTQFGMNKGDFGAANSLAQARGISVEQVKHAGIIESVAGKVRLLKRCELAIDWSPERDQHLTIWECCQYLIFFHEKNGINDKTAYILQRISRYVEAVRDLAYCLYDIAANTRQDAKEALPYNALIADWSELTRLATQADSSQNIQQLNFL
ncbi:DUF1156 domain-containing protein [Bartonella sp. A05]|uniref:DUF1156 domain-containing protein n=1 Tax=Bartonella sp. A05 TaxID=2967261 RepID=UPI0022A9DCAE|nr:DUF1156 domain-containing protein [Bartonella sp. A05]MCZ2203332.1 DUF1156 domain-containing protein [Bartonella sp. A05]